MTKRQSTTTSETRTSSNLSVQVRTGVKAGPGNGTILFNHSEAAKVRPAVQVRTGVKAGCLNNCGIKFNHSEAPKVR